MAFQRTLGFLGFGNMGQAIARGLVAAGTVAPQQMVVFDIEESKKEAGQALGIRVAETGQELAGSCSVLIVAVKPQDMETALGSIRGHVSSETLLISIAAGVPIRFIQGRLGEELRVARVMPNTPTLVRAGAAAVALGPTCTEADRAAVKTILGAVGTVELVSEPALDAVTALSGSGPAYFFCLVECLVKAAVAEGLAEDQALRLAGQTLLGAGRLLVESGESPRALRERVTSKGGTTEAALARFREAGFEGMVRSGVAAAAARSRQLGKSR